MMHVDLTMSVHAHFLDDELLTFVGFEDINLVGELAPFYVLAVALDLLAKATD